MSTRPRGSESPGRFTFLVGKLTRRGAEIRVAERRGISPFHGPWVLRALVRSTRPSHRLSPPEPRIH